MPRWSLCHEAFTMLTIISSWITKSLNVPFHVAFSTSPSCANMSQIDILWHYSLLYKSSVVPLIPQPYSVVMRIPLNQGDACLWHVTISFSVIMKFPRVDKVLMLLLKYFLHFVLLVLPYCLLRRIRGQGLLFLLGLCLEIMSPAHRTCRGLNT